MAKPETMSEAIKFSLLRGLDVYEASVKRARTANAAKPQFVSLYDKELEDISLARTLVKAF